MAAASTLLCIHCDPVQLNLLKENGYEVITATNGSDGLRLLMLHAVDAIVLEYHLGLLDGVVVAHEIKQVRPQLPVVMLADCLELPDGALKSVDALVAKSDGPHFLLETIQSVLQTKLAPQHDGTYAEQSRPAEAATVSHPSKRQILVVDDDQSVRGFIATLLISAGYDVTTAEDGFGALLQLKKTQPDLVLSDLDMPKMSGYELLSVIRRRFPDIPTVAMSGAYQGCDVPRGVVADSFFAKGERPKVLVRILEELLRGAARSSGHHREVAPAWITRHGNESHGMPSVMLTCAECLRAFQVMVVEETAGQVLEIPCLFCPGTSRYIIQPATRVMGELIA